MRRARIWSVRLPCLSFANAVSFANKAVRVIFFKYSKWYYSLYSIELKHAVSQGA